MLVLSIDHALEGSEGLGIGRPTVVETATIVVGVLIHVVGIAGVLLVEGVAVVVMRIPPRS